MLVENIIPRNVIINRGAAEVDNHISRDDFFRLAPSQECYIYIIIPNIIPLLSNHGERSLKDNAMCKKVRMIVNNIFHKRIVFVNSLSPQAGRNRKQIVPNNH